MTRVACTLGQRRASEPKRKPRTFIGGVFFRRSTEEQRPQRPAACGAEGVPRHPDTWSGQRGTGLLDQVAEIQCKLERRVLRPPRRAQKKATCMNRPTWRFIPCRCRRQAPFKMCEGSKPDGRNPPQARFGSREPGPALAPDVPQSSYSSTRNRRKNAGLDNSATQSHYRHVMHVK